jgi:hypothetical protein
VGCGPHSCTCPRSSSLFHGQTLPLQQESAASSGGGASDEETIDFGDLLGNITDEELKEALALDNVMPNGGDELFQSFSQTDFCFKNVTDFHFPGDETNDVLATNHFSNDTEQTFACTMDEYPILNGQFEDNLYYQLF